MAGGLRDGGELKGAERGVRVPARGAGAAGLAFMHARHLCALAAMADRGARALRIGSGSSSSYRAADAGV